MIEYTLSSVSGSASSASFRSMLAPAPEVEHRAAGPDPPPALAFVPAHDRDHPAIAPRPLPDGEAAAPSRRGDRLALTQSLRVDVGDQPLELGAGSHRVDRPEPVLELLDVQPALRGSDLSGCRPSARARHRRRGAPGAGRSDPVRSNRIVIGPVRRAISTAADQPTTARAPGTRPRTLAWRSPRPASRRCWARTAPRSTASGAEARREGVQILAQRQVELVDAPSARRAP